MHPVVIGKIYDIQTSYFCQFEYENGIFVWQMLAW